MSFRDGLVGGSEFVAFVDESLIGSEYYFMSALIIRCEEVSKLSRDMDSLLQGLANEYRKNEIHAYYLFQRKKEWSGFPLGASIQLGFDILRICSARAEALYIEGIDRKALSDRYRNPFNPRDIALQYILERINEFVGHRGGGCDVVLDDHQEYRNDLDCYFRSKGSGTFGYKPSRLEGIASIGFCDSSESRAMQAADVCTYIANQNLVSREGHTKKIRVQRRMWKEIEDLHIYKTRIWPPR